MFSLDDKGEVVEVKCRGLPIKKKERAQKFLDDVLEAWSKPYDPKSINSLNHKTRPAGRHATVNVHAFMPLTLAIASPT